MLTARGENYLHGQPDLEDTIAALRAYQEAGADVLYAPGVTDLAQIRELVAAVEAARELQERGTYTFGEHARPGGRSARAAFTRAASDNP